jgi:hypothetical protein
MPQIVGSIVSRRCNELESQERGVRRWSSVEIQDDRWFQVETCSHADGLPTVTTHILHDLKEAFALMRSLRGNTWTDLRVYSRLPFVSQKGFILEPIEKVFSTREGPHIFILRSGLILYESNKEPTSTISFINAVEIYRKESNL